MKLKGTIVALALVAAFLPVAPVTVERVYSTGVYPPLQRMLTGVSNLVPFALFDVLTVAGAAGVVWLIVRALAAVRRERRAGPLVAMLARLVTAAALVYLAFLGIWGLNYRRIALEDRLILSAPPAAADAVMALGLESVKQLNSLYQQAHAFGWASDPYGQDALRAAFASVQRRLSDAPAAVPGRLKHSIYGQYFRWTSVDGMVNPFALEVLANPDLLPFERPFVAAHEWAHLAGYADESEANFVGWVTCMQADVAAKYSGWLYLFWQVTGEVDRRVRGRLTEALDAGPRRDVQAVVDRIRAGQLPQLRNASWQIYDQYLRANRVEEGIRSYGAVINLVLRAEFQDGWIPVRRGAPASSR